MTPAVQAASDARKAIAPVALRTPLVRLPAEGLPPAPEILLKLECLQPIGSFKLRGAANAMAHLSPERLVGGVLTASAGNMAQGVAYCARRLGIPATVVAPNTAPAAKLRAIERLGGRVILATPEAWWNCFATRSYPGISAAFVHAFDDPQVMAGNGTIGLELYEDRPDLRTVVVPWGGGGLACGIAAVLRELAPEVKVYAAECAAAAPLQASLAAGKPVEIAPQPSFVDGIGGRTVFPRMFELGKALLAGSLVVTPEEAAAAIRLAAERNRVILEGAAGCALAAALKLPPQAAPAAVIASGGNINLDLVAKFFA